MIRRLLLPALLALAPSVFGPGALAEVADADPGDLAPQMADVFGRMGLYTLADMTRRCAIDGSFDPGAPAFGAAVDLHALDQMLAHRQVRHVDFVEALACSLSIEGLDALAARAHDDLMPMNVRTGWTDDAGHLTWAQAIERFLQAESTPADASAGEQPTTAVSAATERTDAEPSAAERVDRLFSKTVEGARPEELGQAVIELADIAEARGAAGIARLATALVIIADPNSLHDTGDGSVPHAQVGRYPVTAYAERWATLMHLPYVAPSNLLVNGVRPPLTPDYVDLALSQTQQLDVGRVIAVLEHNPAAPGLQRFARVIANLPRAVDAFEPRRTRRA